jgi:hypothetical protein
MQTLAEDSLYPKLSKLLTNLQLLFRGTEAGTVRDGLVFQLLSGEHRLGLRRLVPWVVGNLETAVRWT